MAIQINSHPILSALILLFISTGLLAENKTINTDKDNIAIDGYDPVAYFLENKPVLGQSKFRYEWSGTTWLFSSNKNRQMFVKSPTRYAPQFGGFCAYAASLGQFAKTDPNAWSIVNDKLYLNFNVAVRDRWKHSPAKYIEDAEKHWPSMKR